MILLNTHSTIAPYAYDTFVTWTPEIPCLGLHFSGGIIVTQGTIDVLTRANNDWLKESRCGGSRHRCLPDSCEDIVLQVLIVASDTHGSLGILSHAAHKPA